MPVVHFRIISKIPAHLGLAAQRRPFLFGAPEDPLLIGYPIDVPGFHEHPDFADDLIGSAVHPELVAVVDPHKTVVLRLGADVAGTVLESQQVSGGVLAGARRGSSEAQHRPER